MNNDSWLSMFSGPSDEPRDEKGEWTSGGGGGASEPKTDAEYDAVAGYADIKTNPRVKVSADGHVSIKTPKNLDEARENLSDLEKLHAAAVDEEAEAKKARSKSISPSLRAYHVAKQLARATTHFANEAHREIGVLKSLMAGKK